MKYAITIIVTAGVFTVLGIIAAWGAVSHVPAESLKNKWDSAIYLFMVLPIGSLVLGFVVGGVAVYVGKRLEDRAA